MNGIFQIVQICACCAACCSLEGLIPTLSHEGGDTPAYAAHLSSFSQGNIPLRLYIRKVCLHPDRQDSYYSIDLQSETVTGLQIMQTVPCKEEVVGLNDEGADLAMSAKQPMRCSKPLSRVRGQLSFMASSAPVTADFTSLACKC